jgi:hypothetical protein
VRATGDGVQVGLMSKLSWLAWSGMFLVVYATSGLAAEQVGKAVKINTAVVGSEGAKSVGDAVYRDERVRANATGLGQFQFEDGTKLAIGPNASVVIDQYVLGEGGKLRKLALRATKGTFRFIGGRSPASAYAIHTPAGTLGVRGTAAEVQILPGGSVMVVQLEGSTRFCTNRNTCRTLRNRCDFIVANRGTREITSPERISNEAVLAYGGPAALPILRDNSRLLSSFKFGRNECGLSRSARAQIRSRPDSRSERTRAPRQGSPD